MVAAVEDALRLGCTAVGLTLYLGSGASHDGYQEAREVIGQARSVGLPTIAWAYPRGDARSAADETAVDTVAYAAHLVRQLGAHVVKVQLPSTHVSQAAAKAELTRHRVSLGTLADRIDYPKAACFGGTRLLLCSGGKAREKGELLAEVRELAAGGADGSIVGRKVFPRPRPRPGGARRAG